MNGLTQDFGKALFDGRLSLTDQQPTGEAAMQIDCIEFQVYRSPWWIVRVFEAIFGKKPTVAVRMVSTDTGGKDVIVSEWFFKMEDRPLKMNGLQAKLPVKLGAV
jgi:hypothetical protein